MNQGISFFQNAVTPLGRTYCDYFYFISLSYFILFLYIVFYALFMFFFDKRKEGRMTVLLSFIPVFLSYFTNRLLYSMCVGSTQM